VIYKIPATVRG